MKYQLRLPAHLFHGIKEDLIRPHAFAFERIGFLYARSGMNGSVLLGHRYEPVSDQNYIQDKDVGAKIDSTAIRTALQQALSTGDSVFHVHQHGHLGKTEMSSIDLEGLNQLLPSFHSVNPSVRHGALIFSEDEASAWIWSAEEKMFRRIEKVSSVGFPLRIFSYVEDV